MKTLFAFLTAVCLTGAIGQSAESTNDYRAVLVRAVVSEDEIVQVELVKQLVDAKDDLVSRGLAAWRVSELYVQSNADGGKVPFLLDAQRDSAGKAKGIRLVDGQFVKDANGGVVSFDASELTAADNNSKLRRAIKTTLDLFAIGNPIPNMRRDAVIKLGQEQNPEYLPHFENRLKSETNPKVIAALNEAVALTHAINPDPQIRDDAINALAEMRSINGLAFLKEFEKTVAQDPGKYGPITARAVNAAIAQIEAHLWWGNLFGTAFRGLSLASVLLVAALGLAITFGLMGVINMAHGEIIAVGAYTTYVVQGMFRSAGLTGGGFDCYFLVALVASFFTAALVGLILERGVIRFLYKRPLESLLATWGVSLVLQQILRHIFGAANVQVDSPSFLNGSFVFNGAPIGFNRIFVIGFALFIVFGTYLLLTKTSLGLQIRAVMQNRAMASCVGVRTDRVNMLTFALGSGLAGMAGACMSQLANVGPSLGQSYIVDCFMIVVLGGVGNLVGTVSASLGVGVTNQILEPWLGAVLGKIIVLVAIILFLQWRPAGIFVTRSRSLDS